MRFIAPGAGDKTIMDNLTLALRQLDQTLDKLGQILQAEYQLLVTVPLQPIALQGVTHEKVSNLAR
ncbi:hypothetical protein SODG_003214 [Sodalis praecaptivus]